MTTSLNARILWPVTFSYLEISSYTKKIHISDFTFNDFKENEIGSGQLRRVSLSELLSTQNYSLSTS